MQVVASRHYYIPSTSVMKICRCRRHVSFCGLIRGRMGVKALRVVARNRSDVRERREGLLHMSKGL